MNIKKVNMLCKICKDCNFEGITIDNMEELNLLMQENHVLDFNCCYTCEKQFRLPSEPFKFRLPTNFKKISTSNPYHNYLCRIGIKSIHTSFIIFDKVFLKDYKIYLPFNNVPEKKEISLGDDEETIQTSSSLSSLTSHRKTLLINLYNLEEYNISVIEDMLALFNCKIVPFYKELYVLIKPTNTKAAVKI